MLVMFLSVTVFTLDEPISTFKGISFSRFYLKEILSSSGTNFCRKNWSSYVSHSKDFVILACTVLIGLQSVID